MHNCFRFVQASSAAVAVLTLTLGRTADAQPDPDPTEVDSQSESPKPPATAVPSEASTTDEGGAPGGANSGVAQPPTSGPVEEPALLEEEQPAVSPFEDATIADDMFVALKDLSLEDLLNVKVTTASKQEERASEAPSSVSVFIHDDIVKLGVRTLERLLNFVPGFQAPQSDGDSTNTIALRGRHSLGTKYLLILVDDQRLNDPLLGGALSIMRDIPIENVEQVEIIRGPGSALYGANAFLGVINIKTNRKRTNAAAGMGSMQRRYAAVNWASRIDELNVAAFAKVYNDEGFQYHNVPDAMGTQKHAYDPVRTLDGSLTLEYEGLSLLARHGDRKFEGITCCGYYSRYNAWTGGTNSSVALNYRTELPSDFYLTVNINTMRARQTYSSILTGVGVPSIWYPEGPDETVRTGLERIGYASAGNVDLQWNGLSGDWAEISLMVGANAEYQTLHTKTLNSHDPTTGDYLGELYPYIGLGANRRSFGGYVQAKASLWSQLDLTVGARYDSFSDIGDSFNPRAAVVYSTPFASTLKVMYGRAYRAPIILELYGLSPTETADVRPETVDTIEVAYSQALYRYGRATVVYFHNKIKDVIQDPTFESNFFFFNKGEFELQGIEAELRTTDIYGFSMLGTYTHLFTKNDEDKDSLDMPVDFGSVALNYAKWRLSINVNLTICGAFKRKHFLLQELYSQPDYHFLNTHIQFELLRGLKTFLLVENLLDQRFRRRDKSLDFGKFLFRGRTFLVGARVDL
jgi:iron complex outermembrane receptor protein